MRNDVCLRGMIECAIAHIILRSNLISAQQNIIKKEARICVLLFYSYRKPQAMLVEEKSRSVETVEKEPPFAIIRSG